MGSERTKTGRSARQTAAAEAVTGLLRAADTVSRQLEEFFGPYGITGQQYNVLRILRGAREPLPTMEIADRMMQKTPGLTGILDRLERKGLLRRDRSPDDRRVWFCSLTQEGRELLREVDAPLRTANLAAIAAVKDDLTALCASIATG